MKYDIDSKKQYNAICKIFDENLYKILAENNAYIAGGAISSIFTSRPVNDWDIFFRDETSKDNVSKYMQSVLEWKLKIESNLATTLCGILEEHTYGATVVKKEIAVQLVSAQYGVPEEIFQSFDFYCCMGAFDFKSHEFIFDSQFVPDNLMRVLRYNFEGCTNPINSLFRVEKYKGYGYTIAMEEMLKIALAIKKLKLDTYRDLKDFIKSIPNINLKRILLKQFFENPLQSLDFRTDEGKQRYRDYMNQPFNSDVLMPILNDLSSFIRVEKQHVALTPSNNIDDLLLKTSTF